MFVCYNGKRVKGDRKCAYKGGSKKGIMVARIITYNKLIQRVHHIGSIDPNLVQISLKFPIEVTTNEYMHIDVVDDEDVKVFIKYNTEDSRGKVAPLLAIRHDVDAGICEGEGIDNPTQTSCASNSSIGVVGSNPIVGVCRFLKLNVYSLASRYYTRKTWFEAYSESIYPVPPQSTWVIPEEVVNQSVGLPIAKVMPSRRKKLRIPSAGESKWSKKCSRCGATGHYKSTCSQPVPLCNIR